YSLLRYLLLSLTMYIIALIFSPYLSFFFQSSRASHALHSFPTRRSSDLFAHLLCDALLQRVSVDGVNGHGVSPPAGVREAPSRRRWASRRHGTGASRRGCRGAGGRCPPHPMSRPCRGRGRRSRSRAGVCGAGPRAGRSWGLLVSTGGTGGGQGGAGFSAARPALALRRLRVPRMQFWVEPDFGPE